MYENPNLHSLEYDSLFHLGFNSKTHDFKKMFGDLKFVVMGGTESRIKRFAFILSKKLNIPGYECIQELQPLNNSERFSIYKIGPILCTNHGMGGPSISILLNELAKLLMYATCQNVTVFRLGTCGGLGVTPGTLLISKQCYDGHLRPFKESYILGETVKREAKFDVKISQDLFKLAGEMNIPCIYEKTMSCDGFYEDQGRMDGAICEFQSEDRQKFLNKIYKFGIRGMEMEGLCFAATCEKLKLKAVMITSILIDRLEGDQVQSGNEQLSQWENQMIELLAEYIRIKL